jgi:prepilin-type N-terminal cleavage/methylation domain-containing protein
MKLWAAGSRRQGKEGVKRLQMWVLWFAIGQDIANDPTAITEEPYVQRKRRAFTLIEILVVLGIIAALAAMLFLGFTHVSRNSRANLTHVTLQNLRSMMTEYTTSGGSVDRLEAGYTPTLTVTAPAGSVSEAQPLRTNVPEIFQIAQTRSVMNQLLAVPSNQKVLESLPADHIWRTKDGVVLLDGDRNPIIFVPRRGMTVVNVGFTGSGTPPYSNPNQTIFSPGAKLITAGNPPVMEGQPFFASSGEDADFSKGDDNHYSFEQ